MKHIIIIGFKHVGKTSVAKLLASLLGLPYADSDEEIKLIHQINKNENLSGRQIMDTYGVDYFRDLEQLALKNLLGSANKVVIATGGGLPLRDENKLLISNHLVVHITANKGNVFERIMLNGRPAFFPKEEDSYTAFSKIWSERLPVYNELATVTVDNSGTVEEATKKAVELLENQSSNIKSQN